MHSSEEKMRIAREKLKNSITRLQAYGQYPYEQVHTAITNERLKIIEEIHPEMFLMKPEHAAIIARALLDYTSWTQDVIYGGIRGYEKKPRRERLRDIKKNRGV